MIKHGSSLSCGVDPGEGKIAPQKLLLKIYVPEQPTAIFGRPSG